MADNSTPGSDGSGQKLGLTDQLREQASSQLSGRKDRAVEGLSSLVEAARQTGRQLREKDQTGVAAYVETAADQIERFSQSMGNKDLTEIVGDVERFARRQPALFLGVGFGLGLLGARFLKSSRPRPGLPASGGRMHGGGYGSTGGMYDRGAYGGHVGAGLTTARTAPIAEASVGGVTPTLGSPVNAARGFSEDEGELPQLGSRPGTLGGTRGGTTADRDAPTSSSPVDR
jgi:hypothetical protein